MSGDPLQAHWSSGCLIFSSSIILSMLLFQASNFADFTECPICMCKITSATITTCRHRYCEACIHRWVSAHKRCPHCNEALTTAQLIKGRQYDSLIGKVFLYFNMPRILRTVKSVNFQLQNYFFLLFPHKKTDKKTYPTEKISGIPLEFWWNSTGIPVE